MNPAATPPLAVLYENEAWMTDLFDALDLRGVAYDAIDLTREPVPGAHDYAVVFNRVSPSAASRGHAFAIEQARAWLASLERRGDARVVNGAGSFAAETSKLRQHEIIRGLDLEVPRTAILRDALGRVHAPPADFPFPAMIKPDTGGSGEGVQFVGSRAALDRFVRTLDRAAGETLLLQQFVASPEADVMRLEFIGDDLVYAMRVRADNTYNLCPADGCERPAADDDRGVTVRFDHAPDIPSEAVDDARAIMKAAGLDVGGVEYIETHDGIRHYFDINATSSYRADVSREAGIDAVGALAVFLEREIASAMCTSGDRRRCGELIAA